MRAAPAADALAAAAGAARDRLGRLLVAPDLSLPGHPEVLVVGDMVAVDDLPGIAPVAMQEGRYVASLVEARVTGRPSPAAFAYRDKGTMATVGPRRRSSTPTACGSAALPARSCGPSSTFTT